MMIKDLKKTQDNFREAPCRAGLRQRIPEMAMELAAQDGWQRLGLGDVADRVGLPLFQLQEYVEDKNDVLVLFGRLVDRRVLEGVEGFDSSLSPRDILFDLLMERFDVLNDYRAGLLSVLEGFRFDPKQAVISCPYLCRSMSRMLEVAGIETNGVRGALKVAGLTALYLKTLRVWCQDDSVDMGVVMAALDKDLGFVERWAVYV